MFQIFPAPERAYILTATELSKKRYSCLRAIALAEAININVLALIVGVRSQTVVGLLVGLATSFSDACPKHLESTTETRLKSAASQRLYLMRDLCKPEGFWDATIRGGGGGVGDNESTHVLVWDSIIGIRRSDVQLV